MQNYRLIAALLLALLHWPASANDGVFHARGNTLVPLQETQVKLTKELLKFHVRDFQYMDVEVDFEFHNPGPARTLMVGFVTPPAAGDIDEAEAAKHPKISDFTVSHNGKEIRFKITGLDHTGFKIGDRTIGGSDFVYHFPITFEPGINHIRHTYRFQGGASVETQRDFEYRITTGKSWANGQIDDFELQVHLDNGIYYIPDSFQKSGDSAPWKIVGDGVIGDIRWPFFYSDTKVRMAHLKNGYLSLTRKHFKPDSDIFLGEYNWAAGWMQRWCKSEKPCFERSKTENIAPYFRIDPSDWLDTKRLRQFSKRELRLLRNYYFAIQGYPFKSSDLKQFYSNFFWYQPNPELVATDIRLTDSQKLLIGRIKSVESHY